MTSDSQHLKRSVGDVIAFAFTFFGIVFAIAGTVTSCIPAAATGFLSALVGATYFILTGWL